MILPSKHPIQFCQAPIDMGKLGTTEYDDGPPPANFPVKSGGQNTFKTPIKKKDGASCFYLSTRQQEV